MPEGPTRWHRIDPGDLDPGRVTTVVAGGRSLCVTRVGEGWGVLDARCPHQGGPLGEGEIEDGWLRCPWHGYEYDPITGEPPPGFSDAATAYPVEERPDGLYVALPEPRRGPTLMDEVVATLTAWGLDTVFGMVGHSNLGLADAFREAESVGRLRYFGVRHEGAAAFAASAYGKLTGRPAACFSIAGPGATNLLTGLWDAHVDRAPVVALTGQVRTQILGPGAFQEVPLAEAFAAVAAWSHTVIAPGNAAELAALAVKHALDDRGVAHLILPDEVQDLPGRPDATPHPPEGRLADRRIAPSDESIARAVTLLAGASRPVIVAGYGARACRAEVMALAEHLDAPVVTTFKAKGLVGDDHPLACGVVGRSGTPIASAMMGKADVLLVLGASMSDHSGIAEWVPTIHVDADPATLGRFRPAAVPVWGDVGRTAAELVTRLPARRRPQVREEVARRRVRWEEEKAVRAVRQDDRGRMHPAAVFAALSAVAPDDAVLAVDVGNNTYAFGHYFVARGGQDVLMSGYLGSIGFAFPAAMGAWAAVGDRRKVVSISGDGGFGQYMAEFTTAVKYGMAITHILLDNGELGKITREQLGSLRPVWQTDLVNPDFAAYAESCGGRGLRVRDVGDLEPALHEAIAVDDRPALVVVEVAALAI